MLPPLLDRTRPHPADKWLWALLGVLVVGQLMAFWLLCRDQVQKAEMRDAVVRASRQAIRAADKAIPQLRTAQAERVRQQGPARADW